MEGNEHVEDSYDHQGYGIVDQEVQHHHGLGIVGAPLLRIGIADDDGLLVNPKVLSRKRKMCIMERKCRC